MIGKILFCIACYLFMYCLIFSIFGFFLAGGMVGGMLSIKEGKRSNSLYIKSGTKWLFRIISICFTYIMFYINVL